MNSPFKWIHIFLSLGSFSCHWDRLDEFVVFMNSFDEFTFYMNPYISENSIRVFNEFIYSIFISFNKWIHIYRYIPYAYLPHICGRKRCFEESFQIVTSVSALQRKSQKHHSKVCLLCIHCNWFSLIQWIHLLNELM